MIIFCNLSAQNVNKTSFQDEILNGKVKIIKQKIYKGNKVDTMQYIFNDLGLIIDAVQYGDHTVYFYNSDNQIIKSITNYLEHGGVESHTNEYFYENGNLVKHILRYPPSTEKITCFYDYFVTYYKYDSINQLVEVMKFDKHKNAKKESLSEHYIYQYDSCRNRTIEESFDSNGNKIMKIEKKYINNKLIEIFTWRAFEGTYTYHKGVYQYDEKGTLVSINGIEYKYGSTTDIAAQYTTSYFYDEQHRLVKVFEPWYPKNIITTYREFDIYGNWLKKKIIDNDGKVKKTIREIQYFNE